MHISSPSSWDEPPPSASSRSRRVGFDDKWPPQRIWKGKSTKARTKNWKAMRKKTPTPTISPPNFTGPSTSLGFGPLPSFSARALTSLLALALAIGIVVDAAAATVEGVVVADAVSAARLAGTPLPPLEADHPPPMLTTTSPRRRGCCPSWCRSLGRLTAADNLDAADGRLDATVARACIVRVKLGCARA